MQIYSKIILLLIFFISSIISQVPGPIVGKNGMVVSASEIASNVGIQILKKGGNAVDAAVAVGFALAVTYPAAGNLGGGGFMVIRLADGTETTIDYRETAPLKAHPKLYLDEDGKLIPDLSSTGVTSAGVPGSVAGLIYSLGKYGTLPLETVIEPAINLARNGFPLSHRLANSINYNYKEFSKYESSKKIFTKEDSKFYLNDIFIQTDLANTLERIQKNGNDGFYKGETAILIVEQIERQNGFIALDDLANYKPIERKPVVGYYRGFKIISMGPPSAGGIALIQLLNILENYKFSKSEWGSSSYIHKIVESMKYVYADRSHYLGDEDFVNVPKAELTSKEYAKSIHQKIDSIAAPSSHIQPTSNFMNSESEETTHYSIIDSYGNVVSTTTTINSSFGSGVVVEGAGFLLNNEMDDFSIQPGVPNQFGLTGGEANKIEAGKRMLSSMTPTIVFKDDKPFLVLGSPGGSTIITVVLQVIMNVIDFNMNMQDAIDKARIHHQWLPDRIDFEQYGLAEDVINSLHSKGHKLGSERTLGRVEGILIDSNNNIYFGATDPRGYGAAVGY